jgi:hypothetical protein
MQIRRNEPNRVETPGSEVLADYLDRFQEKGQPKCSAEEFNADLVSCVLQNQRGLTPKNLIAAANALQLNTGQQQLVEYVSGK